MATTTNYGWTTPDDTALVKDGAAAIRTLGTSVDTTTKNLNPETTLGDISYRSSTANVNTRLPLGTAGQVLKVNSGATAPEWSSDNAGMTNPMTTTGDTIYSSSGSTPARLAIGSTGNVLTVAGGVPTWAAPAAGGMTLISTATPSGATTVSFTSIATTYKELLLVWSDCQSSTFSTYWSMTLNNDTNGNYYGRGIGNGAGGGLETTNFNGHTAFGNAANNAIIGYTGSGSIQAAHGYCRIFNANEAAFHTVSYTGSGRGADSPIIINGLYADATAITRIDLIRSSSQTLTGTIRLYGLS
jgi:hypothetical protein